MKKFFTLIALALAAVSANAQIKWSAEGRWTDTDDVTVDPTKPAGQIGRIYVNLENAVELGGFQFEIHLPEGVELQKGFCADDVKADVAKGKEPTAHYPMEVSTDFDEDGNEIEVKSHYWTVDTYKEKKDEATGEIVPFEFPLAIGYYKSGFPMAPGTGTIGYFQVKVSDTFEGPATITMTKATCSTPESVTVVNEDGTSEQEFSVQLVKVSTDINTAIDRVDAQTLTGKEIYNLSGQRVSKPSQRGIYIVNGKKIMVK